LVLVLGARCSLLAARCRPLTASAARPLTLCILPYPSGTPRHARLTQHISAHHISSHCIHSHTHNTHPCPFRRTCTPALRRPIPSCDIDWLCAAPNSIVDYPILSSPVSSIVNHPIPSSTTVNHPAPASIIVSATAKLYRQLPYRLPYP
jgi:hypothetical protein